MTRSHAGRPLVVDLFAGAGGLSLGFEQAGYDVVAAVELDPVHAAVHEYNFPYSTTICRSVVGLTGDEIRRAAGIGHRSIHAVVGGAPCQGFSLIGKRALDDPRNRLVREFARLVIELNPRYFVLENVAGLTVGNHRKFLDEVVEEFDAKYRIVMPYRVLQAAEYGVPQSRKRLFLIGAREGVPLPAYPPAFTAARSTKGLPVDSSRPLCPTVMDAIGDLPDVDQYEELIDSDSVIGEFGKPSHYAEILRGLRRDPADFSHTRVFDEKLLTSSMRTLHTRESRMRFSATPPGTTEAVSRFLRLHPDGICNTLRAGTASDRGAHTSPRPIHPTLPRVITVREAARLHGYPDWFRFHVTKWHGFRQVGNSVPPPLARAVASVLLEADGVTPQRGRLLTVDRNENLLSFSAAQAERYFGITSRVIPQRERRDRKAM